MHEYLRFQEREFRTLGKGLPPKWNCLPGHILLGCRRISAGLSRKWSAIILCVDAVWLLP